MGIRGWLVGVIMVSSPGWAAAADEVVAFNTNVKIELAADGSVRAQTIDARLPELFRSAISHQVEQWRFDPPEVAGTRFAAITYVSVAACLAPVADGGKQLATHYLGNGPMRDPAAAPAPLVPAYPPEAFRTGKTAHMLVSYVVKPDGTADVEAIEFKRGTDLGGKAAFEKTVRAWMATQRYLPEQVDGRPISTRKQMPVDFSLRSASSNVWTEEKYARRLEQARRARASMSPACLAASQDRGPDANVVLDSPVRVEPRG